MTATDAKSAELGTETLAERAARLAQRAPSQPACGCHSGEPIRALADGMVVCRLCEPF